MMKMEAYTPTAVLQPFIKAYKIIESEDELLNRVIPNTSFAIAFRFKGQIAYLDDAGKTVLPAAVFSGLRKSVRLINYAAQTGALIIQFQETGVAAFFKQPLHELFEESVALDHFFLQSEMSRIEERLAEAEDNRSRIDIVEQFLCTKLLPHKPDQLVSEAIAKIYSTNGVLKINELAKDLFISNDAFEKRFRKVVGASAKQFSSILKIKTIIDQNPNPSSFIAIALESGYYDQPYFNKDFKLFTGQTPTDFFKSRLYW
jgi:AraC-like DNA-binding protein